MNIDQYYLETRPRATTSVDHMVSAQPVLIPKVTGALTHTRFWADALLCIITHIIDMPTS